MSFTLTRKPLDVYVRDVDAVRDWLMAQIRQEVVLKGSPHPRILLCGDGYQECLDLDRIAKKDRGADPGATFQALRSRPGIERRFVLMGMDSDRTDGSIQLHALLFEEIDDDEGGRRWWCATLPYDRDPASGLGRPAPEWDTHYGETAVREHLFPFLDVLAFPPPGGRAAQVLPPRAEPPDIQVAMDEIPEGGRVPTNSREMVEFAAQLAVGELLEGVVQGSVVVRLAGRAWEQWVLGANQPTSLEDMVRYIANERRPRADGVALVQIAIRPADDPPVVGLQAIGEWSDGKFCESWAPIHFPEGPAGPKRLTRIDWWEPKRVPERGMWLGIDPVVNFELGPLATAGVDEA